MLSAVNLRDPILINTIGHAAGLLLFGVMIALLIRDQRAYGIRQTWLSIAAAALALAWNVGSLVALGAAHRASPYFMAIVMALSFSVLSLLPAILLQLAVRRQRPAIVRLGYAISVGAVCLHVSELFTTSVTPHQLALLLVAFGFGALAIAAFLIGRKSPNDSTEWLSLACLLLFTTSFPHFGYEHVGSPWSAEITWHHIGIPVALVVLLRDYRFLLLDTFVRFLMNSALACGYLMGILLLSERFALKNMVASRFLTGLALVALCLSLILFAAVRDRLQRWLGRVIFRRQNLEERLKKITELEAAAQSEEELVQAAAREVAGHLRTEHYEVIAQPSEPGEQPVVLFDSDHAEHHSKKPLWAEAQIPLRLSSGEVRLLLTGPRAGRQRYLSEDLEDMRRLGSAIVEQVERFRSQELKRLAAKAELRALQAQINPHFLFNALNTLYGSIDRESEPARQMVLNLAEIFRYFLQGDRTVIRLAEELRIVRAYLEIEKLRLGDRLQTEVIVSEAGNNAMIPILSIQPLVENAVKHGVAAKVAGGQVSVRADVTEGHLRVTVSDTGNGFESSPASDGLGMGLENVRRRLILSYGSAAALHVSSSPEGSIVSFQIPVSAERPAPMLAAELAGL